MQCDFFEFDGSLVRDLFSLLDSKITVLKSRIDPRCPEDFVGHDTLGHMHGVAAVSIQRFINSTCQQFEVSQKEALDLGDKVGTTTKITVVHAAANFWKHYDGDYTKIHPATRNVLSSVGIDFVAGGETNYLVGNIFYRCGYSFLMDMIPDLIAWHELVHLAANYTGSVQQGNTTKS